MENKDWPIYLDYTRTLMESESVEEGILRLTIKRGITLEDLKERFQKEPRDYLNSTVYKVFLDFDEKMMTKNGAEKISVFQSMSDSLKFLVKNGLASKKNLSEYVFPFLTKRENVSAMTRHDFVDLIRMLNEAIDFLGV